MALAPAELGCRLFAFGARSEVASPAALEGSSSVLAISMW
jgi:hypothetical protein